MSFLLVSCIYDNNNKKLLGYRAIDLQSYTAHNLLIDEQTCVDNNTKPTSLAKEQFLNAVYDDFFDRRVLYLSRIIHIFQLKVLVY